MRYKFTPAKNPRVLIIQKVYSKVINNEQKITFEKHRFKKFIKDVVLGTIERLELINEELLNQWNKSELGISIYELFTLISNRVIRKYV